MGNSFNLNISHNFEKKMTFFVKYIKAYYVNFFLGSNIFLSHFLVYIYFKQTYQILIFSIWDSYKNILFKNFLEFRLNQKAPHFS